MPHQFLTSGDKFVLWGTQKTFLQASSGILTSLSSAKGKTMMQADDCAKPRTCRQTAPRGPQRASPQTPGSASEKGASCRCSFLLGDQEAMSTGQHYCPERHLHLCSPPAGCFPSPSNGFITHQRTGIICFVFTLFFIKNFREFNYLKRN